MRQISIEIIRKCPNRCVHCSSASGIECTQRIETGKVKEVIASAAAMKTEVLSISGGEPFLHAGLTEIVGYAKKLGRAVYIYTCGVALGRSGEPDSIPEEQLKALHLAPEDRVIFNLPAIDESIYDRFTGTTGNQKFLLESIRRTRDAGITAEIHFVPTKLNIGEIGRVLAYAEREGVGRVSFLGLIPHGRARQNMEELYLSVGENQRLKDQLEAMEGSGVRIGVPLQQGDGRACCHAGRSKLYIRYDGKVLGCEAFKYIELVDEENRPVEPDSIYDNSLEEIFAHSKHLQLEKQFVTRELSVSGCGENCPVQQMIRRSGHPCFRDLFDADR